MTKILLVEDHEELWDFLSRRLRRRGFEVVLAHDGQQAVESAAREKCACCAAWGETGSDAFLERDQIIPTNTAFEARSSITSNRARINATMRLRKQAFNCKIRHE